MKTSYFANPLLNPERHFRVQVSNSVPKNYVPDAKWTEVVPDWRTIVSLYKDHVLSEEEYRIRYRRQLDMRKEAISRSLAFLQKMAGDREIVLLCYETPSSFCHRRILAGWLKENGFADNVKEMPNSLEQSLF